MKMLNYFSGTTNYGMDWINLRNDATVNMIGGSLGILYAYDTSEFNLQGGTAEKIAQFYGSSTANVSGGTINGSFNMYDNSVLNISGGSVLGATMGDSTILNVSGGDLRGYFYVHNIVNI